jgi:hypothetical protein
MDHPRDTSATPTGLGGQAVPALPPAAIRCWQDMTDLEIDNRADAIDYLHHVDPVVLLSTEALAALLDAFPPLPTTHRRSTRDNAR